MSSVSFLWERLKAKNEEKWSGILSGEEGHNFDGFVGMMCVWGV